MVCDAKDFNNNLQLNLLGIKLTFLSETSCFVVFGL